MSSSPMLTRHALTWLLLAQALAIIPHLLHVPLWILALWLFCLVWRIQIVRMRLPAPKAAAKLLLLLLAGSAVYLSRGSLVGLEAGVVLLVAAFILKLVEMHSRRDGLVLIFLGFFVVLTYYLFDSSLLAALYSLLPISALLTALIALQRPAGTLGTRHSLRTASNLLLQALPLMLLMFLLFPRIAPLWSLPVAKERGVTGLAESMSPYDMVELSRSSELAFRVTFEGPLPPREQLYWRGLTLEHFDGRRWSRRDSAFSGQVAPSWQPQGESLSYSVIMQPTGQPWLFSLDTPQHAIPRVDMQQGFYLQRRRPVDQLFSYQLTSWPEAVREAEAAPSNLRASLRLPAQGNPRARAWGNELRARFADDEQLVAYLLEEFNRQPFVYTLRPPSYGEEAVDEFLFDQRRGFCAHYAGAMTLVLRAAGIPARVVAGYQGGEFNPQGSYLQVRQFDAHAWVEYWRPGQGWRSVDPTYQVAPQRIEMSLQDAVAEEGSFLEGELLSPLRYRDRPWLNQLRLHWESINHGWQRWVLGYQEEQQLAFLQSWLGQLDGWRLASWLAGLAVLAMGVLALWLFKPWQQRGTPAQRLLLRYERLLAQHGLPRQPGEGIRAYARRAARKLPEQATAIEAFSRYYEQLQYAERGDLSALRQAYVQLRRRMQRWPWSR